MGTKSQIRGKYIIFKFTIQKFDGFTDLAKSSLYALFTIEISRWYVYKLFFGDMRYRGLIRPKLMCIIRINDENSFMKRGKESEEIFLSVKSNFA